MPPTLPEWFREDAWVPPPDATATTRVGRFLRAHGLADYHALLRRAETDPEWFYPAAFDDLDLPWPVPYHTLVDTSPGLPWARWFVGGRTNLVDLAIERWRDAGEGDRVALVWQGEDGAEATWTFDELGDAVSRAAAGLRALGVGRGDVVALYLPMIPEAAIAFHAAARIGAIVAPAFSGYGVDALVERLRLSGAKILITADGTWRRGATVEMRPVADAAAAKVDSVETVVTVARLGLAPPTEGRHVAWDDLLAHGSDRELERFDADTPVLLAFTSGSTGRPKGAVHAHGRMPYRVAIELAYCFDLRPADRLTWVTDMGWIMGPFLVVCPLVLGASVVMLEGLPDHPRPDRLWQAVENHGITHLGLAPTIVRGLQAHGEALVEPYALDTLRVLGSTGEPFTVPAWRWLHRHVGRGTRPIINYSGGTEVGCGILAGSPIVETPETRFAGPTPGMPARVFDADGTPVVGELGELVIVGPWPAMTQGFWDEPQRYLDTYWSRWDDVWVHGDRAIEHPDGTWELPGRSDDLMKIAGKRIGPVEYESAAAEVDGVAAAAAVGIPDDVKGEVAVLVVLPHPSVEDLDALAGRVRTYVADVLGKAMRPAAVLVVDELPLTRSAKVHRRAARAWLTDQDPGDLSTLENPGSEGALRQARAQLLDARPRVAPTPVAEPRADSPH